MPKSLYYSETIYGGLPLSEAGIDEAYEILDCYHGLYISDCLCADHDYNNRLPNSFNGWSDLYPVKNFNSIKEIREHYLKYVTKEYLDNSNFALWCDEYFEEYGNKLYMRFPSFGFDTFNTDLAEITKMDEDKYLISQPYFVCDNFCCTVLIIIEKIDGSYKMTFSRESQMNYNLGY